MVQIVNQGTPQKLENFPSFNRVASSVDNQYCQVAVHSDRFLLLAQASPSFQHRSLEEMSAVGTKNLLTLRSVWLQTTLPLTGLLLFFFLGVLGSMQGILCFTGVLKNAPVKLAARGLGLF